MTPAWDPNQWKIWNLFVTCLNASLKPICDAFETNLLPAWNLSETDLNSIWNLPEPYRTHAWNLSETFPSRSDTYLNLVQFSCFHATAIALKLLENYLKRVWSVGSMPETLPEACLKLTWTLPEANWSHLKPPEVIWTHLEPKVSKIHDRSFIFGKFIEKVLKTHDTLDFLKNQHKK